MMHLNSQIDGINNGCHRLEGVRSWELLINSHKVSAAQDERTLDAHRVVVGLWQQEHITHEKIRGGWISCYVFLHNKSKNPIVVVGAQIYQFAKSHQTVHF